MKRIRIALLLAGLCWLIGLSPLGDEWQVMVMPQLEWTKTEGKPFVDTRRDGDGVLCEWLAPLRRFFTGSFLDHRGPCTPVDPKRCRAGHAFKRARNSLCSRRFIFSLRSELPNARPSPVTALREVGVGLAQAQFSVTNILLESRSQPVVESLRNLQQQLQSISESVQSMNEKR